jgi:hypothetical protein
MIRKRFQNELQIFLECETNLGLRNKNIHAMKCNQSNYLNIFPIAI